MNKGFDGLGIVLLAVVMLVVVVGSLSGSFAPRNVSEACVAACLQREELAAQNSMALSAWVTVTLTAATGALILLTLHQARRSADAAVQAVAASREIGKAQARAYLTAIETWFRVYDDGLGSYAEIKINNSGQSPARRISVSGSLVVRPWFERNNEAIWAGKTRFYAADVPAGNTGTTGLMFILNPEDKENLLVSERSKYSYVRFEIDLVVKYSDVFGDTHEELFLYTLTAKRELPIGELTKMHFEERG